MLFLSQRECISALEKEKKELNSSIANIKEDYEKKIEAMKGRVHHAMER
jgi:hypothetical protein